jgi:hypothetical protein
VAGNLDCQWSKDPSGFKFSVLNLKNARDQLQNFVLFTREQSLTAESLKIKESATRDAN